VGLGYFDDDGGYVVTASNAGLDRHPGWYFNLRQTPEVHVQIRDRSFRARAVVAEPAKRAALWNRLVVLSPGYAPYARRTKREIPMVTLYPL
jgi:deazaflavin-dependent oxidoreductase (nitroreductase family)